MKIHHTPYHWLLVILVLAALLLTLSEARGQSGAAAVFEGRPAMAGAQAGEGALAGPPQGGIGLQGSAGRSLNLRKPAGLNVPAPPEVAAANTAAAPRTDIAPARDPSLAKDQRSGAKKARRAAKRTLSRARHGVPDIDSSTGAAAR